jgi:hypothetical protein
MTEDPRLRLIAGTEFAGQGTAVLEALDRVRVIVRAGGPAMSTAVLISLAARLLSHIELDGDAELHLPGAPPTLSALLDRLEWLRPSAVTSATMDRVLAVGPTPGHVDLGVGGGTWTVRVGRSAQALDESGSTYGLRVAAGLAIGELVKEALAPVGWVTRPLGVDFVWNLFDYQLSTAPPDLPTRAVTRPTVAVAGVGSVGTSMVAALTEELDAPLGLVSLIDPEFFDARNPYRYPALIDDVTGMAKVQWAQDRLAAVGIDTDISHQCDVGAWIRSRSTPGFDGVLIGSPDTIAGRSQVTDALARETISIGVSGMQFHIARHHLGDGLACPYCQCVPLGPASTQADVYAAETGLPIERILQLLQPGDKLSDDDVALVRAAAKLSSTPSDDLVGHRLDDLIACVYAEISIAGPTTADRPVLLAAPQVSLIAGTLAAVEVRKAQLGIPRLDRRLDLDLTGLPQGVLRRPAHDTSGRCLCASPFRRRWMRDLYQPL